MSDHLSPVTINALVDGELSRELLVPVQEHLAACSQCTASALSQSLLKSATARAGQRYQPPSDLTLRLTHLAAEGSQMQEAPLGRAQATHRFGRYGWAAAAAVLLVCIGVFAIQWTVQRTSYESASLVAEVCDQHIATLAANSAPEVISSDRHTVKPWFQGKIPFSFNLPDNLPADTTLDGANLTYLQNQATAQLLYSIGKHRVSVFVRQLSAVPVANGSLQNREGFHVATFRTDDLAVIAVSDVDPLRLSDLVDRIKQAQAAPK